jgi:hypothetical protein
VLWTEYQSAGPLQKRRICLRYVRIGGHVVTKRIWAPISVVCLLVASGALQAQPQPPERVFDLAIGTMCIGDMPASAKVVTKTIQQGGDAYEEWTLEWTSQSSAATPFIRFFRDEFPNSPGTSCKELKGSLLLSGSIDQIRLVARSSMPGNNAPAQIAVEPHALSVTIGQVRGGLAPLFGGTIELAGSKAWIEHDEKLRAVENQPPEGALLITSWARRIKGAKLSLVPGTTPATLDMTSGQENVTIRVPLDGKHTELVDGRFTGKPPQITMDSLSLPAASFSAAVINIDSVIVSRPKGQKTLLTVSKTVVRHSAAKIESKNTRVSLKPSAPANIERIRSFIDPLAAELTLATPSLEGLSVAGTDCESMMSGASLATSGACTVAVRQADPSSANISVVSKNVRSVGFSSAFAPVPTTALSYSVSEQADKETFSGRVTPVAAKAGVLKIDSLQNLDLLPTALAQGGVEIPISIDLPKMSGSMSVDRDGSKISIKGRVDQFKLRGLLQIRPGADPWLLKVPAGSLQFAASGLVSLEPVLYGGSTQFVGADIRFANLTDLSVSAARSTGQVEFAPTLVTVLDPNLQLAKTNDGLIVRAPARLEASPILTIDLDSGGIGIRSGKLLIENASASTAASGFADIGDVRIEAGEVRFGRLTATYADGAGLVQIDNLRATAKQVSSLPHDKGGDLSEQVQWSGRPTEPIRFASIEGVVSGGDTGKKLRLESYTIKDFCVSLENAYYGDPDGLAIDAERLKFCAPTLGTSVIQAQLELNNGRARGRVGSVAGQLSIPRFLLNITSGAPSKPTGSGELMVAAMNLMIDTPIEIKHRCIGVPDFQKLKARTAVSGSAAIIRFQMSEGQINGSGAVLGTTAKLENTEDYDCRGELLDWKILDEKRVVYDYPCPTWRKPLRMCRGWTVLVPEIRITIDTRFRIYKLLVNYLSPATEIRLRPDGKKVKLTVCLGAVNVTTPLIATSYTAQPRTPVPQFDRLVGDVLGVAVAPFESAVVSGLGQFGTLVMNFLDAADIRENCLR